jgi:hypothetical protein
VPIGDPCGEYARDGFTVRRDVVGCCVRDRGEEAMMGVLERTAVAAIVAFSLAPAASFGQAGPVAPPAGEEAPDVLPPSDFGPGMGGRDCEHERSPGIGV